MRIAIFGDLHGHWTGFREEVLRLALEAPLDLVLQVGELKKDLEAMRPMFLASPPSFKGLMEQLEAAEAELNGQ